MEKDFESWNDIKSNLDCSSFRPLFMEREIWWCSLGLNVGREQDGKNHLFERPILIFRKFNKEIFLGMPISTKKKSGIYYFSYRELNMENVVILSQVRLLDSKRLLRRDKIFSQENFLKLENQFNAMLAFTKEKPPFRAEPL